MRFFTKHINPRSLELWWIQDWVFKSERIGKLILRFFTKQINPRSYGSWCVKGTKKPFWKWILRLLWRTMSWENYISNYVERKKNELNSIELRELGLMCLVKKRKINFRIISDLRIQSWIFLKKRTQMWKVLGRKVLLKWTWWCNFTCFA